MEIEDKQKMEEILLKLLRRSTLDHLDPTGALQYTQAALNVANALQVLNDVDCRSSETSDTN